MILAIKRSGSFFFFTYVNTFLFESVVVLQISKQYSVSVWRYHCNSKQLTSLDAHKLQIFSQYTMFLYATPAKKRPSRLNSKPTVSVSGIVRLKCTGTSLVRIMLVSLSIFTLWENKVLVNLSNCFVYCFLRQEERLADGQSSNAQLIAHVKVKDLLLS